MIANPYFQSVLSFDLFQNDFIECFQPKIEKRMYRDVLDQVLRKIMGYSGAESFSEALKRQPMRGEYDPMFDSYSAFMDFCERFSRELNRHYPIKKQDIIGFLTAKMGFMTDSDCFVDLLRRDRVASTSGTQLKPDAESAGGLFHSVEQFRTESQKLADQLNSIKLSALRLAMAKAQGYRDVRAFEQHLEHFNGEALATNKPVFDDNTFMVRHERLLIIQGPKATEDQRNAPNTEAWHDMAKALVRRYDQSEKWIDDQEIDGRLYAKFVLNIEYARLVDFNALTRIIANFYYACKDIWQAGAVCSRYMTTLYDYAIDSASENHKRFALNATEVWDGESLEEVVEDDDELAVDLFDLKDTVKLARTLFGDHRVEDVKGAVRWTLPESINPRHEEYHACETIVGSTLTKMEEALILTAKRNSGCEEAPAPFDLVTMVVESTAQVYQAMLVTFVLGKVSVIG